MKTTLCVGFKAAKDKRTWRTKSPPGSEIIITFAKKYSDMAKEKDKEKAGTGSGKYTIIGKIKEKYSDYFVSKPEGSQFTSTSLILEGIHFNLVYFPLAHLGYKSVVSAISGLYQKGATPAYISVNLGISTRHNIEDIETIFEGITIACKAYSLKISDIHIESSLTGLTLAITSQGSQPADTPSATGAGVNDLICVTGTLGAAFIGLHILERERKVFEETKGAQPQLEGYEYIIGQQLKPELPLKILNTLKEKEINPTAITVSHEGISSDIIGLCHSISMGCRIYSDKVPVDPKAESGASELGIEPLTSALNGGDDYEFLFTVPVSNSEKIMQMNEVSIIGHLSDSTEGCNLVLGDGSLTPLRAPGWE
jgi:thiamine-monophosphate kinase